MTSNFFRNNVLVCQVLPCYPPTYNLSVTMVTAISPRSPWSSLVVDPTWRYWSRSVAWSASYLAPGFHHGCRPQKKHGCSLQRHIDASWGGTQNILDQQPYLITNEPLVLLHKCITMNSISRSSCNAFLARRSHIQLVCQPGYQHCDETTSRSPLILP